MEEENKLEKIISKIDKFRLIDIISTIYYYFRATGEESFVITTVELEYIINLIYKTKNTQSKQPSKKDILLILQLTNSIIVEKETKTIEEQDEKDDIIFKQARADFLYVKEDTQYSSMVFEYLNLFSPVDYFLSRCYGFMIKDFLLFSNYIQIEYVNRMFIIEKLLKKSYEKVTINILLDYIFHCNCNMLNFNEKTLATSQEQIIAFKNILNKFSVYKQISVEKRFEEYPILKQENTYIFTSIVTLLNKAKCIFEKEIRKDRLLGNFYAKMKGEYLEILTENVMKEILKDAAVFPNVKYRENKQDRECDLLIIYDQIILIVEIKGRAFKDVSRQGSKDFLQQDLNDNIYRAYKQASRMEKYLRENNTLNLRFGRQNDRLKIENTDKFKILKIGITLENFRKYAVQYTQFNNEIEHDMLFLSINDLKFMAKYFKYQTEFIHYISQRIKTNQYINEFYLYDELYLFSEYKMNNLQCILNNDHKVKIYDHSRYKLFDLRFDEDKKEKILKGNTHPLIDEMIKEMETQKTPTYALTIMELLDLDYKTQKYIFEQVKFARLKYKQERKVVHICLSIDEARDSKGMYIVIGVANNTNEKDSLEGAIVLGSMLKRKHPNYEVIGVLNDVDDKEEKIVTCINIREPRKGFDSAIDNIKELKELYTRV